MKNIERTDGRTNVCCTHTRLAAALVVVLIIIFHYAEIDIEAEEIFIIRVLATVFWQLN